MTLRRYCLRGVFRFYPLQSLQPFMPSYHNRYRKASVQKSTNSGKDMIPAESIYNCYTDIGYTPETEVLLEKERQDVIIVHQAWQAKQVQTA